MKTLVFAAAIALVAALNVSSASAAQYAPPAVGQGHWEWQYHYVGHHPEYRGDWIWVK